MSCYSSEWPYDQDQSTGNSSLMSHYLNDLRPATKKKSRCSKKQSPVTILNADVSNFRALVQQLTGRPSEPTRLRAKKGPLTINFRQAKEVDDVMFPFGFSNNKYHHQQQPIYAQHKQQGFSGPRVGDHMMLLSNEQSSQTSVSRVIDQPRMNMEEFDDINIDKCLEELASIDGSGYHHHC
ncbi:uncharacterized protein LOC110691643 [Chenopodium quinoa]|uniref:uncharacterized protein LOC110691643 n=1 Tax=Chenopodium quinoa TaxID=63459 RepID=UPI000B799FC2|nr:uncharacterized protein LOC110691643 [Chenopodium quinoa]